MGDLVELIVDKYDGSLKAEHGTGLNMAPYVEREWGAKATEMMWRIKALADPAGVLAPGVLLNRDPGVHLRNLKSTPPIEEVADNCVECGFCEPVCPSRHLTTTPRQRIVLRREMARQAGRVAGAARAARRVRVRRARDVRRGRHVHARVPARHRHRQAREGAARARSTRRARSGSRWRVARRWAAVERAARAGSARPRRAAARRDARCCGPRSATSWCRPGRPTCRARRGALPATRARGRRGGVPAGVHEPHLRPRARRRTGPQPAGGAGRGVRARGAPGLDPAGRGGPLLRRRRGARRATGPGHAFMAAHTVEALWRWTDGGQAAGRDRRQLVRAGAGRGRRRGSRCSTPSPGRTTGCCRS